MTHPSTPRPRVRHEYATSTPRARLEHGCRARRVVTRGGGRWARGTSKSCPVERELRRRDRHESSKGKGCGGGGGRRRGEARGAASAPPSWTPVSTECRAGCAERAAQARKICGRETDTNLKRYGEVGQARREARRGARRRKRRSAPEAVSAPADPSRRRRHCRHAKTQRVR